jgi:tetratricopeptide (TPR) repeat protein
VFIPSGDSAKALPYLEQVIQSNAPYRNPAKYMYAWMLLQSDEDTVEAQRNRAKADLILAELVDTYPESRRFALRYLSNLVLSGNYQGAIVAAELFISTCPGCEREPADIDLARIWLARAQFETGALAQAEVTVAAIETADLPRWAQAWYVLTVGNLEDINGQRSRAQRHYREVLDLAGSGISQRLSQLAESGLEKPYVPDAQVAVKNLAETEPTDQFTGDSAVKGQ